MEIERPEIVALFYSALTSPNDVEQLFPFLSPKVEWLLSTADPQTFGEESPSNAITFSGKEGFRQPIRAIWGEKDRIIPASHAAAIGKDVHILANAGHSVQMEAANEVNRLLKF